MEEGLPLLFGDRASGVDPDVTLPDGFQNVTEVEKRQALPSQDAVGAPEGPEVTPALAATGTQGQGEAVPDVKGWGGARPKEKARVPAVKPRTKKRRRSKRLSGSSDSAEQEAKKTRSGRAVVKPARFRDDVY